MSDPQVFKLLGELDAWIAIDPETGEEGILGLPTDRGFLPACGDATRMDALRSVVVTTGRRMGLTVRRARFTLSRYVETLEP